MKRNFSNGFVLVRVAVNLKPIQKQVGIHVAVDGTLVHYIASYIHMHTLLYTWRQFRGTNPLTNMFSGGGRKQESLE